MLLPQLVRTLTLDPGIHPRGQPHLSAASGLVQVNGHLYLVADDEQHLATLSLNRQEPLRLLSMLPGPLPQDAMLRKARKADLETLAWLPPLPHYPYGALLTLGSGSTPQRERGVLLALDAQGRVATLDGPIPDGRAPRIIDLSRLYAPLRARFSDLNIEGCFVAGGDLHLLQRGNQSDPRSVCIHLDWMQMQAWLLNGQGDAPQAHSLQTIDMGSAGVVDGVQLSVTDATAMPDGRWAFSAVAENTHSSYLDGPCIASAIGIMGADGRLEHLHRLQGAAKVEGICTPSGGKPGVVMLVTDTDNPAQASQLLTVQLPPH